MNVQSSQKMDVPRPVYNWLLIVKAELRVARGHNVTWPDVFDWLMAQHQEEETAALTAEAQRVESAVMADRARRAAR